MKVDNDVHDFTKGDKHTKIGSMLRKTSLDEFEKLLEESFAKSNSVADIVEGTVIKKEQDGYLWTFSRRHYPDVGFY